MHASMHDVLMYIDGWRYTRTHTERQTDTDTDRHRHRHRHRHFTHVVLEL